MEPNMNNNYKDAILKNLNTLKVNLQYINQLDDSSFYEVISLWHEVFGELKSSVFDPKNKMARNEFEEGWGAQSLQFVIDCIPEFHRILLTHYKRSDDLTLLDVGAGSGLGTNLFTRLHSGRHIFSKISVEAIDYIDTRKRWVETMYPKINYRVADVYDLPKKHWDIVFCSHVIEHVPDSRGFLKKLVEISKGFLFVYSPYNEIDRIPAHRNTITETFYSEFSVEKINIFRSMGWHPAIPSDYCILAVIDCRE